MGLKRPRVFSGGVHGHAGPVHEGWRGLHHLLLHHGPAQLPRGARVQAAHLPRAAHRRHPRGTGGQQIRPDAAAAGERRRDTRSYQLFPL